MEAIQVSSTLPCAGVTALLCGLMAQSLKRLEWWSPLATLFAAQAAAFIPQEENHEEAEQSGNHVCLRNACRRRWRPTRRQLERRFRPTDLEERQQRTLLAQRQLDTRNRLCRLRQCDRRCCCRCRSDPRYDCGCSRSAESRADACGFLLVSFCSCRQTPRAASRLDPCPCCGDQGHLRHRRILRL